MENITGILAKREVQKVTNILVCDDDKDIVNALKIFLFDKDYRFFEAYNGLEALDIIRANDIHIILMQHKCIQKMK